MANLTRISASVRNLGRRMKCPGETATLEDRDKSIIRILGRGFFPIDIVDQASGIPEKELRLDADAVTADELGQMRFLVLGGARYEKRTHELIREQSAYWKVRVSAIGEAV